MDRPTDLELAEKEEQGWGKEKACQGDGEERCRGRGETGKGKASRLDWKPAGQTEGNQSLDGPRGAVWGTGIPEGRGGWVSAGARSCQPRGAWVSAAPRRPRDGEKPRLAGGLMDGLARCGWGWVGGDMDTLNLRSSCVCFGKMQGEGRPLLHSRWSVSLLAP